MPRDAHLDKTVENAVSKLVKRGRYKSRDDVFRAGVRLVEAREKSLAEAKAALERSIADIEAGRVRSPEKLFAALQERLRKITARDRDRIMFRT
jgi:antitoxin ParD1/3/4